MTNQKPKVAYFCMEYGLHEDLKIYSGGLGILAGDILKAAKDANDPMVGVGILWRQGYTSQHIDENGKVFDSYHEYSYDFLKDTGVTVSVKIRDDEVKAKVFLCEQYGNVPLYLLDTNIPGNPGRYLTGQLYGWFNEERIGQEMILSIGGIKALRTLGINVDVYHFNDSHPVVAGNEIHEHKLLEYMGAYDGLTKEQMTQLGGDPFSMTAAGLRLSKKPTLLQSFTVKLPAKCGKTSPAAKKLSPSQTVFIIKHGRMRA